MNHPLDRRHHGVLALSLFLGLGLAFGLTTWAHAQEGTVPNVPQSVEVTSGTTITVNTEDDELNNDGDCSLREAVQAANTDTAVDQCPYGDGWDTIILPAGTFALTLTGAGDDANATGDLDVRESVTIIGAGASYTTIDGHAADRVFHVAPNDQGVAFELREVMVTNGASDVGGGLRAANGLTRIQDSVFRQNKATSRGGAIQADLGTVRILSSSIEYNDAGASGKGGGVYVDKVALTIRGSTILSNTAQEGGGLYNNYGSVTVQNTAVISNAAFGSDTFGGGISSWAGNLIVEDTSEIGHNQVRTSGTIALGGGIYTHNGTRLTIMDSWIHHNQSEGAGAGVYAYGYGSYVRNSTIEHNRAEGEGGGFYAEGDLILVGSTLRHNHSDDGSVGGGGVYAAGSYGALVISNTMVYSNTTEGYGGGVHFYENGGAFVTNSIFRDNQAKEYGGGFYVYFQAGLVVEDSVFEDNGAIYGGAIYLEKESGLTVERSTFSGNRATTEGGALYLYEFCPADIRNSTFSQNQAGGAGGAIYITPRNIGIQSSTIVSNTAGTRGGGIYAEYHVSAQNSIIAGNSAGGNPAASDADCYMSNEFFSGGNNLLGQSTGCEATRYDQALAPGTVFATVLGPLADNGGPKLPDGSHPETHALLGGSPAIDAANDDFCPDVDERGVTRPGGNACDIGAHESSYSASVAAPSHHIIAVTTFSDELNNDGDCSLREAVSAANTDTAFDQCPAGDGWDTISLAAGTYTLFAIGPGENGNTSGDLDIITPSLTIRGAGAATTTIDGNGLDRTLDVGWNSMLFLDDVTVTGGDLSGQWLASGACVKSGDGLLMILDSVTSGCKAAGYGGGISVERGVGRLVNATVKENRAVQAIGGLYNNRGVLSSQDSVIINNSAGDHGGGVWSKNGVTRFSHSDIFSNTVASASSGGGGIYHEIGNLILDEGTRVMYNGTEYEGGGVYCGFGALKIEDSTISHNFSRDDGGGVSNDECGLWMRYTQVEHNVSHSDGGGLYYANGLIEGSTIRYNEAVTNTAGGLDSWSTIVNSTIANNKAALAGGIWAEGVGLYNSVVKDNTALDGSGGGLYIETSSEYGGATIVDSTFSGNVGHSGEEGSGVYADKMPVTARGSTFSGNSGADLGGAIYSLRGVVDILNSTVSGNGAVEGAGVYVLSGTVSLNYSTVANNTASGDGGGVYNAEAMVLENSVVAGNEANGSPTDGRADCEAMDPITYGGYGLFGNRTGCDAEGRGDQAVAPAAVFTAVLGPLADNGGPPTSSGAATWTHALLVGSPGLDAIPQGSGGCGTEVDVDQRGVGRPQWTHCDVGAYEARSQKLTVSTTGTGSGSVDSSPAGISCPGDCDETYALGTVVTLTASASPGSTFGGWSGACTNATGVCVVTMDAAKSVTATFILYKVYLPFITRMSP